VALSGQAARIVKLQVCVRWNLISDTQSPVGMPGDGMAV